MQPLLDGGPWASRADGPIGVLCLHGYTGNPRGMRELAERFAAEGWSVDLPLLPGHGAGLPQILGVRWDDLVEAAETAYARLARDVDRIVVAGLSAGGALACHLAASYPGILGIVAINPATRSPGPDVLAALEAARAAGFAALPPTPSDIADPTVPEPLDGGTPVIGLLSLLAGLDTVPYAAVRTPILLFSSRVDHVVDPCHGDHLVATAAGPVERVWLERSWHVATRDYDKELLFAAAIAFVARVAGGGSPAPRGIHRAASER